MCAVGRVVGPKGKKKIPAVVDFCTQGERLNEKSSDEQREKEYLFESAT